MTEPRLTVTSCETQPLSCQIALKVGSTFLRNLLYVVDHGEAFSSVEREYPKELYSRALTREQLASEVSFFVVRDPIARFFSLYFDKAIGDPDSRFPWLVEILTRHRVFHTDAELSIAQHRDNCMALLGFLGVRLRRKGNDTINPHWNKQFARAEKAIKFGLPPLMLENLDRQIIQIADGRIDGLEAAISKVKGRNRSPRPVEVEDIITPEIYQKISKLYPEDIQLYDLVKTGWELMGKPPEISL